MRLLLKILLTFAVGAFCFNALCLTEQTAKTEKIKIISAYCLNDKWRFQIHDAVKNKTLSLKLGTRNAQGYKVENFDQTKKIAIIKTPSGRFEVAMQEVKLPESPQSQPQEEARQQETAKDNTTKNHNGVKKISRISILRRLK